METRTKETKGKPRTRGIPGGNEEGRQGEVMKEWRLRGRRNKKNKKIQRKNRNHKFTNEKKKAENKSRTRGGRKTGGREKQMDGDSGEGG